MYVRERLIHVDALLYTSWQQENQKISRCSTPNCRYENSAIRNLYSIAVGLRHFACQLVGFILSVSQITYYG